MLSFIHAADFHLDAPFAALPPDRAAERRGEQRALLERLADLAEARRADLVLLSGDLLDSEETYAETVQALSRALGRIRAPVFIAPGNHDFWSARSPYAALSWPENVHIFTGETPQAVPLPELGCTVYGAAFTAPHCDASPLRDFNVPSDGGVHLMVLHGDVDGQGDYGTLSREDIAASGLTYLALGHIHACSGLQRAGGTCWAYPGCPEGRGFDELGEKGVLYGSVEGGEVSLEFVPLAARRYRIEELDVSGRTPEGALEDFLPTGPSPDLCRILLTGECGTQVDLERLEELAAPWFYSVSLRDRTHVRRDLWDRAGEDTLTGLFLREMRRRLDEAPDDPARALVEQAVRFGLAALEHGEDPFG